MRMLKSKPHGFTLLELMITVAVVAILATIAYPSYQSQLRKSRRTEGTAALLNLQIAEEKYFLVNNQYGSLAALGLTTGTSYTTEHQYYQVSLGSQDATSFVAQAVPINGQSGDSSCNPLTLSNTGQKTPTSGCW
jgi:type IV pilus assembly protein PilE